MSRVGLSRVGYGTIISFGFLLTITRATRIAHPSATLIDNILLNSSFDKRMYSGILTSDISDHFISFRTISLTLSIPTPWLLCLAWEGDLAPLHILAPEARRLIFLYDVYLSKIYH